MAHYPFQILKAWYFPIIRQQKLFEIKVILKNRVFQRACSTLSHSTNTQWITNKPIVEAIFSISKKKYLEKMYLTCVYFIEGSHTSTYFSFLKKKSW